jgi:hypothetical protein
MPARHRPLPTPRPFQGALRMGRVRVPLTDNYEENLQLVAENLQPRGYDVRWLAAVRKRSTGSGR